MAHPPAGIRKHVSFERERGVYGISVTPGLAHISVDVSAGETRAKDMSRVFNALGKAGVPISLIKIHADAVTFVVHADRADEGRTALSGAGFTCHVKDGLAIIKIAAGSMRDLTGVLIRVADSLSAAGARMYATGDSHDSVLCLVDGTLVDSAVRELSRVFGLDGASA